MSGLVGPNPCHECHGEYGQHEETCSRYDADPKALSEKIEELATSKLPDTQRLQVLIKLVAELARETYQ